jgi:hypothetical protein
MRIGDAFKLAGYAREAEAMSLDGFTQFVVLNNNSTHYLVAKVDMTCERFNENNVTGELVASTQYTDNSSAVAAYIVSLVLMAKRATGMDRLDPVDARFSPAPESVAGTSCSICRRKIAAGELIGDRKVYERNGALDYIELFHADCKPMRDRDAFDACPGCGCEPGDGATAGCTHPEGCGYFKEVK